jgi:hypothetical protein
MRRFLPFLILGITKISLAQGGAQNIGSNTTDGILLPNPLGENTTIQSLIDTIFQFLAFRAGPIVVTFFIILGAYQIVFSGGEAEKVTKGKNTIAYAAVGYAILLLATAIVNIVKRVLTVQ